jgi:hypothetical protein
VKKATLPKSPNSDLQQGFTVAQVDEKHIWPESLVWAFKLDGKNDATKYQELRWGKKDRLKVLRPKSEGEAKNTNSFQPKQL